MAVGWSLRKSHNGEAEPKRHPSASVRCERWIYKTYRNRRSVSFDDWLLDCELESSALAKAKNGTHTAIEERYCDCPETLVNGERVPCPPGHNCEYARARSELVPTAERRACEAAGISNGKDEWMRCFADAMEELAAPLLNGNGSERERQKRAEVLRAF